MNTVGKPEEILEIIVESTDAHELISIREVFFSDR